MQIKEAVKEGLSFKFKGETYIFLNGYLCHEIEVNKEIDGLKTGKRWDEIDGSEAENLIVNANEEVEIINSIN